MFHHLFQVFSMKIEGFSLVEIIVAVTILAIVSTTYGSLFVSFLDHRQRSDWIHSELSVELALQFLASDIENSLSGVGNKPAINITSLPGGGLEFTLRKYAFTDSDVNIQGLDVRWVFDGKSISRSVNDWDDPIVIADISFSTNLLPVGKSFYRLDVEAEERIFSIFLWRRADIL